MEKIFRVLIDDTHFFEFTESEISAIDVLPFSSNRMHLISNNKSVTAKIADADFLRRSYVVEMNSSRYRAQVFNELEGLIKEMGLNDKSSKAINQVNAPMPGLILEVNVKPGQEVMEGDHLLVLEAMKMENTLVAPKEGIVKEVSVKKGQTVDKNQLLIEME